MASEGPPVSVVKIGGNISISLSGVDGGELHGYWDNLSDGGSVLMPIEKQMWGDEFGMCVDRFGISWMVNIAGSPQS
jgi:PhnB protein